MEMKYEIAQIKMELNTELKYDLDKTDNDFKTGSANFNNHFIYKLNDLRDRVHDISSRARQSPGSPFQAERLYAS